VRHHDKWIFLAALPLFVCTGTFLPTLSLSIEKSVHEPRIMKYIAFTGAVCILLATFLTAFPVSGSQESLPLASNYSSGLRYRGINLAGHEFGPYPSLYPVVSDASQFGLAGMNAARIPFAWELAQPVRGGSLATSYIASVTALAEGLLGKGWFVLVDLHAYMRYNHSIVNETELNDIWHRLTATDSNTSATFNYLANKYPEMLAFDIMNEPHDMSSAVMVANLNAAVAAVRNNNLTNMVFLEGNGWSGLHSWNTSIDGNPSNAQIMLPPHLHDPANNIVINVHNYLDPDSSGTNATCIDAAQLEDLIHWQAFADWLQTHRLKAFLSEFNGADNENCRLGLSNLLGLLQAEAYTEARGHGFLGYTVWAAGHAWGSSYLLGMNPGDLASPLLPAVYINDLQPQCDGFILGFNKSVPGIQSGYSMQAHNSDWSRKQTLLNNPNGQLAPPLACVPSALGPSVGIAMYDEHGKQYACPGTYNASTRVLDLSICAATESVG
jgi:endoglucanase